MANLSKTIVTDLGGSFAQYLCHCPGLEVESLQSVLDLSSEQFAYQQVLEDKWRWPAAGFQAIDGE